VPLQFLTETGIVGLLLYLAAAAGALWGASYASLFEAFYRARVTVVSPLVGPVPTRVRL